MNTDCPNLHSNDLINRDPRGSFSGFTLIELVITIAVLGVMVATAVPAVNGYMTRHAPQYAADEMFGDIQLARMRAARFNRRARIVFNVPGPNQYTLQDVDNNDNVLGNFKVVDLAKYRDAISFVPSPSAVNGPPFATLQFLSQGIVDLNPAVTAPANSNSIFLSNLAGDVIYRIFVSAAGGSGVYRWDPAANQWR